MDDHLVGFQICPRASVGFLFCNSPNDTRLHTLCGWFDLPAIRMDFSRNSTACRWWTCEVSNVPTIRFHGTEGKFVLVSLAVYQLLNAGQEAAWCHGGRSETTTCVALSEWSVYRRASGSQSHLVWRWNSARWGALFCVRSAKIWNYYHTEARILWTVSLNWLSRGAMYISLTEGLLWFHCG